MMQVLRPSYWYQKSRTSNFANVSCILAMICLVPKTGQNRTCCIALTLLVRDSDTSNGVQTVGRKTSWAKDVWANYFLGDRRLGDNSHFKKDVLPKDGWATKA